MRYVLEYVALAVIAAGAVMSWAPDVAQGIADIFTAYSTALAAVR